MTAISFICPRCRTPLENFSSNGYFCSNDGLHFDQIEGVWRFLLPERADYFKKFIKNYETIRRAEERGSQSAAYYHSLPYQDLSGKMSADWHIRAVSFDVFLKRVILRAAGSLRILDLGAGNGWLSNRLAARGHSVAAVDLMTNDFDGLGCNRFYETGFTSVQAEFDRLPFPDHSADLIVFNASLHYSIDIRATLAESLRVLDADGKLVVLDSPLYHEAASGEKMVRERENQFTQKYGFASNALPSQNYLTYSFLKQLCARFALKLQIITPWYGLRWWLRPLQSKLFGRREPARFHVLILNKIL